VASRPTTILFSKNNKIQDIYKFSYQVEAKSISRRLKKLDRTQSPFAATREISIEGCESASIAGRCRNVQGVSDVNTICNGRKCQLDALSFFNLHPGQTQRSFDRMCDCRVVEVVWRR